MTLGLEVAMPESRSAPIAAVPLSSPPDGAFPAPPVETQAMALPFGELSWENFERLCHRLVSRSAQVEFASRYGRQGQAQQGLDVFARLTSGRYEVWQAKRYSTFTLTQLRRAIAAFLKGDWVDRTERLVIAVQANLDDVAIQNEIEAQATALAGRGIALSVLGGDSLVEYLRPHQDLVLSFFGRGWFAAFYGGTADAAIARRLDGAEFARVRAQLARIYTTKFSVLDQSIVGQRFSGTATRPDPLGLLDRYAMTDVYVRERVVEAAAVPAQAAASVSSRNTDPGEGVETHGRSGPPSGAREDVRRVSVASWLTDGDQIAVVADAGAGKSTLLRCIALDLLSDQSVFPALCERWGDRLPVVVSFAKWARLTAEAGGEVSLRTLIETTLQPLMTADFVTLVNRAVDERRIVLIVDGLDEWSAEQAARLTLQTLLTYVEVHEIPTVVSGRPHGLRKIGTLPQSWKAAELAPLSEGQQRELANSWFRHLTLGDGVASHTAADWAAERFLRELRADAALGELAETPLLFIGLLALAVRDVALPRNRTQAMDSLIRLLLEIHPESRATAAGDVIPRFEAASTWEVRQSALAALAFASRQEGGDAGYPRARAEQVIRDHLAMVNGYDPVRASAAASEMLAVNAETVGLVVEKAPGDIGFAHASLEEFLCAVHIQSWRFADLKTFVADEAGNPRWRNVLRNLVAINPRTSEIDEVVEVLEGATVDVFGALSRQQLLAEITFGPSAMAPVTAWRLADQAFDIIDGVGPEVERAGLLRIALNGLSDPTLGGRVEERVRRWAPRRYRFTASLYHALRDWPADALLLDILFAGLRDVDRGGAREAAGVLARRFGGRSDVETRLRALIGGATDLHAAAAALEALVLGWPGQDVDLLVHGARTSRSPLLRAVALWARTRAGLQDEDDRRDCVHLISFDTPLDYWDRDIAKEALFAGWPDDDRIVSDAIATLGFGRIPRDTIDRDLAVPYLINTAPGRPEVEAWMLEELKREYPFTLLGSNNWGPLARHCEASPAVREGVIQKILSKDFRYREHDIWEIIATVRDARLRDHAIARFREPGHRPEYWSLLPLLEGWSDDPLAQAVFAEAVALDDDQIGMLASLLPRLYGDPAAARARLLRIARTVPSARWDLIVRALGELGCDGSDAEAVAALLPHALVPARTFVRADGIFALFGEAPDVRAVAHARLDEIEAPLSLMARGMPDDPVVRERVLMASSAASHNLRTSIVAACGTSGDRHPVLSDLLASYALEADFQLRVQLAADFYSQQAVRGAGDDYIARLQGEANRNGPDWEDYRATAFAGLLALGRPEAILEGEGAAREISMGASYRGGVSGVLCALIVENWDPLKVALGADFLTRIRGEDQSTWEYLCRYVGQNLSARADFLSWCGSAGQIGPSALRTLADLAPRSDLLHNHLLRILQPPMSPERGTFPLVLSAAAILRDQFPGDRHIQTIIDHLAEHRDLVTAMALAIIRPEEPLLADRRMTASELGETHDEWLGGIEWTSRLEPADQVVRFVRSLAERQPGTRWGPGVPIDSLVERIRRDPDVRDALGETLANESSPDAFCAAARLLAAAGELDERGWQLCADRLATERASKGLPVAVLDIAVDDIRPLSHVLADLVDARSVL